MKRLSRLLRIVQRKGWLCVDIGNTHHDYPNHDTMRHEATNCPCGPVEEIGTNYDGSSVRVTRRWSLDAREAH